MGDYAQRLLEARNCTHMTQSELARILGISRSAVAMYEQGEREPSKEMFERFSAVFHLPPEYLMGWVDIPRGFLDAYHGDVISAYAAYDASQLSAMLDGSTDTLTDKEIEIVHAFRVAEPAFREEALQMLKRHPMK